MSVLVGAGRAAQQLAPRAPLVEPLVRAAPLPPGLEGAERRLTVKFVDAVRARSADGAVASLAGVDLGELRALAALEGLRFRPLILTPPDVLSELETRAAQLSGRAQPDLAGMMIVELPQPTTAELERVGNRLSSLAVVEYAYIETLGVPPPTDIAPTTPDLVALQTYRGPDPGMDVDDAWARGAFGQAVRLSDCEYGWDPTHEDLNDIDLHLEPGQTIHPSVFSNGWDDHGTAVLGETSAPANGYGCNGMAPGSTVYTWPEWTVQEGPRRLTCITNAIAASSAGDVVLLEMQMVGDGGGYGPAELDPNVWTVVQTGTYAGVIVVGAAGNGNQDLDSAPYAPYRARGDSGAILVGAGSANTAHSKLSFSTFGSRVDVQGWGQSVFTLGYGSYAQYGGDDRQSYTDAFGGTSSAAPFVASACAILSSHSISLWNRPPAPTVMRELLVRTGVPQQGGGGHIGPFPDLRAALDEVQGCPPGIPYCASEPNSTGAPATMGYSGTMSIAANDLILTCRDAPAGQTGLFYYGAGLTQVPFGNGYRCVSPAGSGLHRLNPPITVGSDRIALQPADYTRPPMDAGNGAVSAGSTWNFQFWFRDPMGGGTAFDLSNGLSLTFCP